MNASRLWSLVLVAALSLVPVGPPEHAHEISDGEGHHALIVHRHTQLHTILDAARHSGETFDHPDPITIDADGAYVTPPAFALHVRLVSTPIVLPAPPVRLLARRRPASDRLIHAPPRAPASPRAPPRSPLL